MGAAVHDGLPRRVVATAELEPPAQPASGSGAAPRDAAPKLPLPPLRGAEARGTGTRETAGGGDARPPPPPSPGPGSRPPSSSPGSQASPPARLLGSCGSGWGGVRTPTDDFVDQRRKSAWHRAASEGEQTVPSLPPRVYVDSRTLIREVTDVRSLQRGDHCLIAINLVRCASPTVDRIISCLGSIELCYLYHHFIIVDDVHRVDDHGVPRTAEGQPARIFECGNTIPEALGEIRAIHSACLTGPRGHGLRQLLQLPRAVCRFVLFCKVKFTVHPLADYGDTPHLYIVLAKLTPEERERIATEALRFGRQQHHQYHLLFNNCEHMCNLLRRGVNSSAMVPFGLWALFRVFLGCMGLLALRLNQDLIDFAGSCYQSFCYRYPARALAAYHVLTTLPVALQAMISYSLLMHSIWRQHLQALIDRQECYHLLGKELGRTIVVGGFTVAVIALTPEVVSGSCSRFVVCAFAYAASDVFYNCCAHAVMRLVLLPTYGRVWLLGPSPKEQ